MLGYGARLCVTGAFGGLAGGQCDRALLSKPRKVQLCGRNDHSRKESDRGALRGSVP
jgi:hypothetical protein